MEQYKSLYKWMIIPFVLSQVTIFNYYWPRFTSQTWEIHIHFWLVTLWFLLAIVQPWLISQKNVAFHRTLGMFGLVIAGGVIFSGMSLMDVPLKLIENLDPGRPGPPAYFYYAILIAEFCEMLAFAYAVAKAIQYRRDVQNHAWWLVASVFFMIVPALGRGMIVFWRAVLPPENFSPLYVAISTELIYLPLFLFYAFKFGKIKHPATYIGILLVVIRFVSKPLGAIESVQEFLQNVIIWK